MKLSQVFYLIGFIVLYLILYFGCYPFVPVDPGEYFPLRPPPTESNTLMDVDGVTIKIQFNLWQDIRTDVPKTVAPPKASLELLVKNLSGMYIENFRASKLTLFPDSGRCLEVFKLVSKKRSVPNEIAPDTEESFVYTTDVAKHSIVKLQDGSKYYARIVVEWNGKKRLLHSPLVPLVITY